MANAQNPLKLIFAIKKEEWPLALSLFAQFFLIITVFWILKPLKTDKLFAHYDNVPFVLFGLEMSASQAELIAKALNIAVAALAVAAFSNASNYLRRQNLIAFFAGFIVVALLGFSVVIENPSAGLVWSFYLFGDLFNTLMLAAFFSFANDILPSDAAKRLYGVIGLGGVLGGSVGSTTLRATMEYVSSDRWMWIAAGAVVAIVGFAFLTARFAKQAGLGDAADSAPKTEGEKSQPKSQGGLVAAARLVFNSRYLLALVALVAIYELVSTVLDFQYKATLEHYSQLGAIDRTESLFSVYAFTNNFSLVVQLFLTSFVMQRFNVGIALLFLPLAVLGSSATFAILPIFLAGAALSVSDNGLNYSINQSARETLYTVTTREEKYKAKAFIDMLVQRSAKGLGLGFSLIISSAFVGLTGARYLTFITIPLLIVWILIVRYLGKRFEEREEEQRSAMTAAEIAAGSPAPQTP
ncbi:MAG: Npt1/Npt2 family nucleotide transporter [Myxococcota bacterium]